MKTRDNGFGIKAESVTAEGAIAGYGSVFNVRDSQAEIVVPGAFARSIKEWAAVRRPLPMLNQHNSRDPLGVWDNLREDDRGLYVEGRVNTETQTGREVLSHIRMGAVTGLSIGYQVRQDRFDPAEKVRYLQDVRLQEISLVTFPACDPARIAPIKARGDDLPTEKAFEKYLREAGFSRTEAAAITGRGLTYLLRRSESGDGGQDDHSAELAAIAAAIGPAFRLPSIR